MKALPRSPWGVWILPGAALMLAACTATPACDVQTGMRTFEARAISEQWIDYVWAEIPPASPGAGGELGGTAEGRLFVASADPVGAIVPTMVDLLCAAGPVTYAPAEVEFTMDEQGGLRTSYEWGNCARCSECYMRWTFSLEMHGQVQEDALVADLVLNETFHDQPMRITSLRMGEVTNACTEPRLTCEADGTCGELRYEVRK